MKKEKSKNLQNCATLIDDHYWNISSVEKLLDLLGIQGWKDDDGEPYNEEELMPFLLDWILDILRYRYEYPIPVSYDGKHIRVGQKVYLLANGLDVIVKEVIYGPTGITVVSIGPNDKIFRNEPMYLVVNHEVIEHLDDVKEVKKFINWFNKKDGYTKEQKEELQAAIHKIFMEI